MCGLWLTSLRICAAERLFLQTTWEEVGSTAESHHHPPDPAWDIHVNEPSFPP